MNSAFPGLVPELLITDLAASLAFWVTLCDFEIVYDRPSEGFAYLRCGTADLMLDQIGVGRDWTAGALERPLGRGVNFQITVAAIEPLVTRLASSGWPLFLAPETRSYRTGGTEAWVSQFLVQDPDGYLIRFTSPTVAPAGHAARPGTGRPAMGVTRATRPRVASARRTNSTDFLG